MLIRLPLQEHTCSWADSAAVTGKKGFGLPGGGETIAQADGRTPESGALPCACLAVLSPHQIDEERAERLDDPQRLIEEAGLIRRRDVGRDLVAVLPARVVGLDEVRDIELHLEVEPVVQSLCDQLLEQHIP